LFFIAYVVLLFFIVVGLTVVNRTDFYYSGLCSAAAANQHAALAGVLLAGLAGLAVAGVAVVCLQEGGDRLAGLVLKFLIVVAVVNRTFFCCSDLVVRSSSTAASS